MTIVDRVADSSRRQSGWVLSSLIFQAALLAYYELVEWVNIFPWNDIRRGNGQETVDWFVTLVVVLSIAITFFRLRWAMIVAALLYAMWLWLQIEGWWIPYVRGASPGWARVYARFFSQTVKFLPSSGSHLAPDACHILLQGLIAGAIITTLVGFFEVRRVRVLR